jgi:hypothetical protein
MRLERQCLLLKNSCKWHLEMQKGVKHETVSGSVLLKRGKCVLKVTNTLDTLQTAESMKQHSEI